MEYEKLASMWNCYEEDTTCNRYGFIYSCLDILGVSKVLMFVVLPIFAIGLSECQVVNCYQGHSMPWVMEVADQWCHNDIISQKNKHAFTK